MKQFIYLLFYLILPACILLSCGKHMVQVERGHRIYVSFLDKDGNDLLSKSDLVLDKYYPEATSSFLSKNEYSLRMEIDGEELMDPDIIYYSIYKKDFESLSFSCDSYDLKLTKKHDYIYSYYFSCPKLFGDKRERLIEVKFKCKSKGVYDRDEIRFEGEVVCEGKECTFLSVVLN